MLVHFLSTVGALVLACSFAAAAFAQEPERTTAATLDGELIGYPRVEVRGMTVYEPNAAWHFAMAHILHNQGRVTAAQMAKAIELVYREDGYFLARVHFVPGAERGTGIFEVNEGRIDSIEVVGVDNPVGERIVSYMRPILNGKPVKLSQFERAMMLAGDLSGVSVRSELTYPDGADGDKVDLKIYAKATRSRGSIVIDSPPAADSMTATLLEEVNSVLFSGDMVRGILGGATDFNSSNGLTIGGYYRTPIGNYGTYTELYAGNSRYGRNISGVLNDNYQQSFNAIGVVGHPFLRDFDQFLYLLFESDYAELNSYTGSGRDTSEALRATLLYSRVNEGGTETKIGTTISGGWAGGTNVGFTVDPTFWHFRAGVGTGVALDWVLPGLGFRTEAMVQATGSALPAAEKMYLGDRERNRGYPIAVVSGDSGFSLTNGLHKHFNVNEWIVQAVAPYAFFDLGYVSSNNTPLTASSASPLLTSTGVGVRAFLDNQVNLQAWVGVPLVNSFNGQTYGPTAYVRLVKFW